MPQTLTGRPAFLRALDNVLEMESGGYLARCPFFGCEQLLTIIPGRWGWIFQCPEHTHEELQTYLEADTRLDPHAETAAWRALCLAPSLEVWIALLLGEPVHKTLLDPVALRRFRLA